jgi:hypothetical protein
MKALRELRLLKTTDIQDRVCWIVTDLSEEHDASMYRAEDFKSQKALVSIEKLW